MNGEHLPWDQEAEFIEFEDETLRVFFSESILDFLVTNDISGDDKATSLKSEPSPTSTVVTAPKPSPAPVFLGAPNSKHSRVGPLNH